MASKRQQESGAEKRKNKKLRDDTRASFVGKCVSIIGLIVLLTCSDIVMLA